MKVVLFCGGLGLRLYPATENVPKPLVQVGGKPILLLLMKYYSYFGHKDFILCLGYKGDEIKKFFLNYDECPQDDFVLSNGVKKQLIKNEIHDWNITFAETGLNSNVGQRLLAVRKYLEGEDVFLANYSDALTDLPLSTMINYFNKSNKIACLTAVKPVGFTFHYVSIKDDGNVQSVSPLNKSPLRINGGFFVFKKQIFDYINPGEELVIEPFERLIKQKELIAYQHDGFWASLDTYKDKQRLDELASNNASFWEIWGGYKKNSVKNNDKV
jgi:glucose-1-phosphate cytidylyltransferase